MQKSKPLKTMLVTLTLAVLLTSVMFAVLPISSAHTPPWTIPTYAFLSVSPDPVGVGQTVFVVMWIDKPPPTAAGYGGDRWQHFTVEVTLPNGNVEKLGGSQGFTSDATSSTFTTYTPLAVGTYTFVFKFPGQVAKLNNPLNGLPGQNSDYINDTYSASSATTTLTVQEEQVAPVPNYPLPTSYWTRPIEGQNTAWASISSNYLYPALAAYTYGAERLQPDGTAPNSPHIMWTKPIQFGGVVGGTTGISGATYYSGLSYETKFNSPIIIYGRMYYGLPRSNNGAGGGYVCVDLRTGERLWWQNYTTNPTFGQLYLYESFNQHGVMPGYLWAISGSTWNAYDASDGNWLFSLTDVPSGTMAYGVNGEVLRYVFNYNATANRGWLGLWNNTAAPALAGATGTGSSAYQWRPVGKTANASQAYTWNVTLPSLLPNVGGSATVRYVMYDDLLLGSFGSPGGVSLLNPGCTVFAISLKPASRGSLLWIKNYPAPDGNITRQFEAVDPVTRMFTMSDKETRQWSGFSLDDGNQLWGPVGETRAFNYYATVGSGGVSQVGYVAYGNLYTNGYGGELFCYSMKNGSLLWKYNNTNSGLDTPWGLYPLFTGAICDGKIYLFSNEHSPNVPQYKGEKVRCLNALTGEELWTMLGWAGVGGFADWGWPVADGFIAYLNTYDMQVYCLGKGPSATTVMVGPKVVAKGTSVVIEGTVTDISAGAKQLVDSGRFNIVPAMSDRNQAEWMEYLYMQKPMPTNVTGVPVTIFATDPNGNTDQIGEVTSDSNGLFYLKWMPSMEGAYKINVVFQGSNSFWPSSAETVIGVDPAVAAPTATIAPTTAPTETPIQTATPAPTTAAPGPKGGDQTVIYVAVVAVAIIIAIAAVAVFLRRRK